AAVAREAESKIRTEITALLRAGQELGHVEPTLDPAEASAVLMAAADGLGLRMTFMNDFTAEEAAKALKNLVLRYLNPASTPIQIPSPTKNSAKKPIGASNDA
ncbi:MAG: TetR family transcriptional regulator C-terminal domain-containing protein, partial [Hyphomonadaceae bacterium]